MNHVKSESEVTSIPASSPARSPSRRVPYYVQSPSRDSHDGGDSKASFQSTPLLSPTASPLNTGSSIATASPFSRTGPKGSRRFFHHSKTPNSSWPADNVIEEEPYEAHNRKQSQLHTALFVIFVCLAFLFFFILFFWLACRPSHPNVSVKDVVFHNFFVGTGGDASGVPTKMITLNCSVRLTYNNPSKFFGAHVNPVTVYLHYSELTIATGQLESYVQKKKTTNTVSVLLQSEKVPIYGAGATIDTLMQARLGIPILMTAVVESQFNVVGKMVRSRFENKAACNLVLDSTKMKLLGTLNDTCTYDPSSF